MEKIDLLQAKSVLLFDLKDGCTYHEIKEKEAIGCYGNLDVESVIDEYFGEDA